MHFAEKCSSYNVISKRSFTYTNHGFIIGYQGVEMGLWRIGLMGYQGVKMELWRNVWWWKEGKHQSLCSWAGDI